MKANDHEPFVRAWTQAWELYGKPISPGAIQLAYDALQRFDLQAITRALTAHVNDPDSGQYPPKPADVVRLIEGRKEDRAQQAWTKVEGAMRRVGQYATVVFDDALIHAVIRDMGGWIDLCSVEEDELPFRAREFEKRYQGYLIRGSAGDYPKMITGRLDQTNQASGFGDKREKPILLGDPDRARQVYAGGSEGSGLQIMQVGDHLELMKKLYGPESEEERAVCGNTG